MNHPILGELTKDETTNWWQAKIELPKLVDKYVSIEDGPNFEENVNKVKDFQNWYLANQQKFINDLVEALFDFDLIWPENFIENADNLSEDEFDEASEALENDLEEKIKIKSINIYDGILRVWLDTGGYTTDHLVQTKLDNNHRIKEMEL